jgi:ketosteroid isomerase-like protein
MRDDTGMWRGGPKLILLILCFAPVSHGQIDDRPDARSQANNRKEVLAMEQTRDQALLNSDSTTLDHLLADDISWTSPNGAVVTKSQLLTDVASGKETFPSIAHENVQVHIYGNTALVFGVTTSTVQFRGTLRNRPRRFSNVWVKRAGEWQLVAHVVTEEGGDE